MLIKIPYIEIVRDKNFTINPILHDRKDKYEASSFFKDDCDMSFYVAYELDEMGVNPDFDW